MREIRQSGSVRGVRRKPYPYRDPVIPVQSTVLFCRRRRGQREGLRPLALTTGTGPLDLRQADWVGQPGPSQGIQALSL